MNTNNGKTVFLEYSSSNKGQHFMTVIQTRDHRRIIIGRIYREYDKENNKTNYLATDFEGNQVFADIKDLPTLKKKFIEHGPSMAMFVPKAPEKASQKERLAYHLERNNDLKNIRDKKVGNEKTKEVSGKNSNAKENNNQKERDQDYKTPVKYKEADQGKEEEIAKENEQEQEITEPENANQSQAESLDDEFSEREAELDSIRDQDDDFEQDIER